MDITAVATLKALDGLLLRQTVTANNVANANSEGFVPSTVSFESVLRNALRTGNAFAVATVPLSETALIAKAEGPAPGVRVDMEMANMSEVTMNYLLLVNMLDRKMSMTRLALNDGRSA